MKILKTIVRASVWCAVLFSFACGRHDIAVEGSDASFEAEQIDASADPFPADAGGANNAAPDVNDAAPHVDVTADSGIDMPDPAPEDVIVELRECGRDGEWCWAQGASIGVVDGSSSAGVYAAGRGGTFLRWDGDDGWTRIPVPMYDDISDIYVAAADSIWVAASVGSLYMRRTERDEDMNELFVYTKLLKDTKGK
jgi:hypothetical protein